MNLHFDGFGGGCELRSVQIGLVDGGRFEFETDYRKFKTKDDDFVVGLSPIGCPSYQSPTYEFFVERQGAADALVDLRFDSDALQMVFEFESGTIVVADASGLPTEAPPTTIDVSIPTTTSIEGHSGD